MKFRALIVGSFVIVSAFLLSGVDRPLLPQLLFALVLLVIGGVLVAFNAMIFWITVVQKEDAPAVAPIVGGPIAAVGIALLPLAGSWKWAWVALVVDWGGLPLFFLWYQSRSR